MLIEKHETSSTNDDARLLALDGAPHGTAVLARRQRAGRGRDGRSFSSPEGGMYLSVVLRPAAPAARWGLIPIAAGVAVVDALAARGFDARVKWPNDVLLGEGKVAGVLVESHFDGSPFAIVGIGVNVLGTPLDAPGATCLAAHGRAPPPRALALDVQRALLAECDRVARAPRETVARAREKCATIGRAVEWDGGAGVAVDVDEDGALVVENKGRRLRIVAGDVRVRQA